MQKFLKLKSIAINTLHISKIITQADKHYIHMNQKTTGGFVIFYFGFLYSDTDRIEICKLKHCEDYKTVSNFIDNM